MVVVLVDHLVAMMVVLLVVSSVAKMADSSVVGSVLCLVDRMVVEMDDVKVVRSDKNSNFQYLWYQHWKFYYLDK